MRACYKKKSVDYLLEEINLVKDKYPLKNVHFNDDIFIINKKWFFEFAEKFPELNLSYTCNIRANLLTEDIAEALVASHCRNVTWSIESGNDEMLKNILRKTMTKKQILKTSACLHKHKIPFRVSNLIGLPGETIDEIKETIEVNIKSQPSLSLANIFIPYPNVDLTKYSIKHGYFYQNSILPRNYFSRSPLNFTKNEHDIIYKTFCLFPALVKFPVLFYCNMCFKFMYFLPKIFLRLIYELFYAAGLSKWYAIKTPMLLKIRMAFRYILYY
ncbi:MAG: radical SAM protein [Magnetococcales bacterium]|nr:radical SAM protein [Magnetococcales bacterium]